MTLDVLHAEYAGGGPGFVAVHVTARASAPAPALLAPPALLIADAGSYRRIATAHGTPPMPAGPDAPPTTLVFELPLHLATHPGSGWWLEPGPALATTTAAATPKTPTVDPAALDDLRARVATLAAELAALRERVEATPTPAAAPVPPPRPARRLRPSLPAVMIAAGALATADAVATVTWQEPISALWASHQQHALQGEVRRLDQQYATPPTQPAASTPLDPALRMQQLARTLEHSVRAGHPIGELRIPRIGAHQIVVQGTRASSLARGPGHYADTALPGEPGTVGIAGHRTTYGAPFRHIDALRRGDPITLSMPYGEFVYRVEGTRIVRPEDASALRAVRGSRLVLTACHPLYSAAKRIVVLARLERATPRGAAATPASSSAAPPPGGAAARPRSA